MRIGMMLRCFDEKGGIGVYTRNLIQELLSIDRKNQYTLFYRNSANLGRFAHLSNVTERVIRAPNKVFWDQIAIPYACWKEKVNLVFHPKFTIPLLAPCKAVMVVHGADWFIPEQAQFYSWLDIQYMRWLMPQYFKKCQTVISVSEMTRRDFIHVLQLPANKIKTIYLGPARVFKRVTDKSSLMSVKKKYDLPSNFILTLTRRGFGGDKRKNLGQIFKAYADYHGKVEKPYKLIVGGKDGHLFRGDYDLPESGYSQDVHFPGWLEQEDLPAIYSMADLYLYPSNLETAAIPIMEAMACGTPIITSNVNGLVEIAGDAALMVNPGNSKEISDAIYRVLSDSNLREMLSGKGLARSRNFSWDSCAKETLAVLESLAA